MCFSAGSKWYLCLGFLIRKRDEAVLGYHLPTRMGWGGKTGQLTCQLLGARTCFDRLVFDGFSHQFGIIMFCELRVGYPPHGAIYNYFGITYLFLKGVVTQSEGGSTRKSTNYLYGSVKGEARGLWELLLSKFNVVCDSLKWY